MITTTTVIVFAFVLVGFVFYSREQYTTYPGVNERRLNTIKQLSDDVLRDLQKMSPTHTRPPLLHQSITPTSMRNNQSHRSMCNQQRYHRQPQAPQTFPRGSAT